jgi:hypothetical protein
MSLAPLSCCIIAMDEEDRLGDGDDVPLDAVATERLDDG